MASSSDDTADNLGDLLSLFNKIQKHSHIYGLKINMDKTKMMIVGRDNTPHANAINDNPIESVSSFKYFDAWITKNRIVDEEIQSRIEMARIYFIKFEKIYGVAKKTYNFVSVCLSATSSQNVYSWSLGPVKLTT